MSKPVLNSCEALLSAFRWIYRGQTIDADGPDIASAAQRVFNAYTIGPELREELVKRGLERFLFEELEQVFTGDGLVPFVLEKKAAP